MLIRVVFYAAAAALLMAPAAVAQTIPAACVFSAQAPAVPDGTTATNAQMTEAREALLQWRSVRSVEVAACKTALDQVRAQLNAVEAAYNQGVTESNTATDRFTAENAEYTARARPRREGSTRPNQ